MEMGNISFEKYIEIFYSNYNIDLQVTLLFQVARHNDKSTIRKYISLMNEDASFVHLIFYQLLFIGDIYQSRNLLLSSPVNGKLVVSFNKSSNTIFRDYITKQLLDGDFIIFDKYKPYLTLDNYDVRGLHLPIVIARYTAGTTGKLYFPIVDLLKQRPSYTVRIKRGLFNTKLYIYTSGSDFIKYTIKRGVLTISPQPTPSRVFLNVNSYIIPLLFVNKIVLDM